MKNKISKAISFQGKLMATVVMLTAIIFNTQIANAQADSKPAGQKQTETQQKNVQSTTTAQSKVKPVTDVFNGKSFDVTLTEKGKEAGEKDHLVFSGKKFESKYYMAKGFQKSDYTVSEANGITSFQAKASSPTEGNMTWKGTLKGDMLSGTAVMIKKDKTSVIYQVNGKIATAVAKTDTKTGTKPTGN